MARWHSCNVLHLGAAARQVWQFDARKTDFKLSREQSCPTGESLPDMVNKSWSSLWQPRLNVAWLPLESVFLRVVHLPPSGFEETLSMVELQLEKISPIPVTQLVWSVQVLPQSAGGLQTLIVILAERKVVEDFLGQLEGQGYLADRLELPVIDQLLATTVSDDGAWIYPGSWGGKNAAILAWWYGGVLQNLNLIVLPAAVDPAAGLKEQLAQMTWAGELEGWLTAPPTWHLVADKENGANWEPLLRQSVDEPIVVSPPLPPAELAALTAKRATHAEPKANLLPAEYATRYKLQFQDRLWMRAILSVGVLYLIVVAIYFVALGVLNYQTGRVETQVRLLSDTYTNSLQLKARYQVLKDRQDLKFAGLDCWKVAADLMPASLTLEGFVFSDGKKLHLNGTAPSDARNDLIKFSAAMRKATVNGQPLFDQFKGEQLTFGGQGAGAATVSWNFGLELKRVEEQ